jgi:hypothetical protein
VSRPVSRGPVAAGGTVGTAVAALSAAWHPSCTGSGSGEAWRTGTRALSNGLVVTWRHVGKPQPEQVMVEPTGQGRRTAQSSCGAPSVSWRMPAGPDPVVAYGHRDWCVTRGWWSPCTCPRRCGCITCGSTSGNGR